MADDLPEDSTVYVFRQDLSVSTEFPDPGSSQLAYPGDPVSCVCVGITGDYHVCGAFVRVWRLQAIDPMVVGRHIIH